MHQPLLMKLSALLCLSCNALLIGPLAFAADAQETQCQARLHVIMGDYLACRLKVEAAAVKGQKPAINDKAEAACEKAYQRRYAQTIRQGKPGCSGIDSAQLPLKPQLDDEVNDTVSEVKALITDVSPPAQASTLIVYNNCAVSLKLMSPTNSTIDGMVLGSNSGMSWATSSLNQNAPNTFMFAPVTTDTQCKQLACQNWSDIQAAGQREGYMWGNNPPHNNNLTFAAYCQPTNAAAKQCTTMAGPVTTSPCCGSQMVYDKTYGTTFEITPNGGTSLNQDFVDLSTNYGSGPETPPPLCNGNNANNCVTAQANIFFNVPVQVQMINPANPSQTCAFPPGNTNTLTCTQASCPDAYQYPTDAKQAVCQSGTGYVVTLCPGTKQLPVIATQATLEQKITIKNNLNTQSPCPIGNTVTVFTKDGAQHVIQPGGNTVTIAGNYAAFPGFGLQVNNWYWTSQSLPVQAGNPQNPDNSGAQFMLSDQCSLSQSAPVYGKGIETYKIAAVTAQKSTTEGCLVTVGEKPPYTDAVTPGCCAPPLPNMGNVCQGPWGVTNNQQPWPPQ